MHELNMVLLCHVGEEHSIDAGGLDQSLGNPLKLRAYAFEPGRFLSPSQMFDYSPLNAGVKVIAAHCASEGENIDLDDPVWLPLALCVHTPRSLISGSHRPSRRRLTLSSSCASWTTPSTPTSCSQVRHSDERRAFTVASRCAQTSVP